MQFRYPARRNERYHLSPAFSSDAFPGHQFHANLREAHRRLVLRPASSS